MQAKFLGHACWLVETAGKKLVIDPWLSGNPMAPVQAKDLTVDYVLITHGHADHNQDAEALVKANKAMVISTAEIAGPYGSQGHSMHIGGTFDFDFGTVRIAPAFHGSGVAGGHACGFVITSEGKTFYHAGDTSLFGDMRLLGELVKIDLAALPIGGNYTMNQDDAVIAARWLKTRQVVPMHYNTFPVIAADPYLFKQKVESSCDCTVAVLQPGESLML